MWGLFLAIGMLVGFSISIFLIKRSKTIGTIVISRNDDDYSNPYIFLEIDSGKSDKLYESKHVYLKVENTHK